MTPHEKFETHYAKQIHALCEKEKLLENKGANNYKMNIIKPKVTAKMLAERDAAIFAVMHGKDRIIVSEATKALGISKSAGMYHLNGMVSRFLLTRSMTPSKSGRNAYVYTRAAKRTAA